MDLSGNVTLGHFTIPLRFLAAGACLAAAILVARVALRRHRHLRAVVTERLANAVVIFIAAWKLAPVILHPLDFFHDPLSLLMGAPGIAGLVAGIAAASVYAVFALVRPRRLRRASVLPLFLFAAVIAAGVGLEAVGSRSATPGPLAPAFSLPTLSGNSVSLTSLRGRVVVVNFWATWCPPCRAELPALADFARGQGAAGAVLLSVNQTSTETSEEAVRAFVKKYEIVTDVLLDGTGAAARAWDVQAYPSTFVVDPKGRVSAKRTGAVDLAWLRGEVADAR
ncbi:MAG: peroxiredoxin family protein [Spirochaetia bacterium]